MLSTCICFVVSLFDCFVFVMLTHSVTGKVNWILGQISSIEFGPIMCEKEKYLGRERLELSTSGSLNSYETYALANCATTPFDVQ